MAEQPIRPTDFESIILSLGRQATGKSPQIPALPGPVGDGTPGGIAPVLRPAPSLTEFERTILRIGGSTVLDTPEITPADIPPPEPTLLGEFGKGVKRGTGQTVDLGISAAGLASQVVGADETAQDLFKLAQNRGKISALDNPAAVDFDQAFDSVNNFALFAASALGEQIPVIATIIAGGGIGGIIGRLVAKKILTKEAAELAVTKFASRGAAAGAFGAATVIETGSSAQEQFDTSGEVETGPAVVAGIVKGSLESLTPLLLGKLTGLIPSQAEGLLAKITQTVSRIPSRVGRAGAGFAGGGFVEGATETLQETVDVAMRAYVDENFDVLSPEVRDRLLESGTVGIIVGSLTGGLGGGISRPTSGAEAELRRPPTEQELDDEFGPTDLEPDPSVVPSPTVPPPAPAPVEPPSTLVGPPSPPATPEPVPPPTSTSSPTTGNVTPATPLPDPSLTPDAITDEVFIVPLQAAGFATSTQLTDRGVDSTAFLPQSSAQANVALRGRRNVQMFKLKQSVRDKIDVSAPINVLPASPGLLEFDGNVRFVGNEANKAKALKFLAGAITSRNVAQKIGFDTAEPVNLTAALATYRKALDLGIRYDPVQGKGFVSLSPISDADLVEVSDLEVAPLRLSDQGVFGESTIRSLDKEKSFLFPLGSSRKADIQESKVAYKFDLDKVPEDQLTTLREGQFVFSFEEGIQALNFPISHVFTAEDAERIIGAGPSLSISSTTKASRRKTLFTVVARVLNDSFGAAQKFPHGSFPESTLQKLTGLGLRVRRENFKQDRDLVFVGKNLPFGAIEEVPGLAADRDRSPLKPKAAPRFFQERIASAGLIELSGRLYTPEAHKIGEVVIVVKPQQLIDKSFEGRRALRILKQTKVFFEAQTKKLNISDMRIVVLADQLSSGMPLINADGAILPVAEGWGVISISTFMQKKGAYDLATRARIQDTMTHEFGHYVGFQTLASAPQGIKNKILSAYNRSLIRATVGPAGSFRSTFFPPIRFTEPILDFFAGGKITDRRDLGQTGEASYWLGFDEWFADQVSRWVQTFDRTPVDSVERFFQRLGKKIQLLFKNAFRLKGKTLGDFLPEVEVEAFLNSLINNKQDPNATHLGQEAMVLNVGTPENPGPEASTHNQEELFKKLGIADMMPKGGKKEADRFGFFIKHGWNILQLASKNTHIKGLQSYVELVDQWYNFKMSWIARADERVRQWKALGKGEIVDNLSKFIFDVDAMVYLSKEEKDAEVARQPTDDELGELSRKHNLTAEAFEHFLRIKEDFDAVLNQLESTAQKDIGRTITDPIILNKELTRLREEFTRLRNRPYFPHSRFGDFTVVVKDDINKTVFMEQYKTRKEAILAGKRAAFRWKQKDGFKVRTDKIPEEAQVFRGLPASLLSALRSRLNLTDVQKKWLDQFIIDQAPSQSFRRRLQKRENIPGFSLDAMRSYANYFWHASNHLARIEFGGELQDKVTETGADASRQTGNIIKRREIVDFMQDHLNHIMNPQPDWAQLRSFAFQWWLGFSVQSAAVNFTQIPMVAWPYLSAQFGDFKAAGALRKASLSLHNLYLNKGKIDDLELRAIDLGIQQGFLDESQATELAGTAEGNNLQRLIPGNKAQRWFMQSAHWSAFLFQASEKINRRVVFRATYQLAKTNPDAKYLQELRATNKAQFAKLVVSGWEEIEATAFLAAKDAIRRTQYEYASWARPRFMRGKKGTLFTFFMFLQNTLWFARHSPGRGRYLLILLFAAGLMGLPGAEDLAAIAKFIGRNMFGKEFDVEKELREFLINTFGEDPSIPPDLILHGTSRVGFGMHTAMDALGLPFPMADLSANLSMGQIIPGVAELGAPGLSFEERFSRVSTDIAGASFGIGLNVLKALTDDSLPVDDFKRWERAMPRAVKNVLRARRFAIEGRERTRAGGTVAEFDASDPDDLAEIIGQAMGFNPTKLTRRWDRDAMRRETEQYWVIRRGMLMRQFDHSFIVGDREATTDVRDAIQRYNNEVPFGQMRITGANLSASRKARNRSRALFERGVSNRKGFRALGSETNRLFPEVEEQGVDVEKAPGG